MRFTFNNAPKADYKYRGLIIDRYKGGWIFEKDDNIYVSIDHACNAIDAKLGGYGRRGGNLKRIAKGIKIIGQK